MNRERFLLDRKCGIGGSDVAAIMGISPWRTALDVYNDKISSDTTKVDSDAMQRGRDLENAVLRVYANKTGNTLIANIPMLKDRLYPFLIGNIDAKVKDSDIIVEAKTTRDFMSSWGKEIPEHYKVQVAHYASIANAERVEIVVLFGGLDFGYFTYERDEELERKIRKAAIDFWHRHILATVPPSPQNLEELKNRYPDIDANRIIEADEEIKLAVAELHDVEDKRRALEKSEETLKLRIQQYMGDAGILEAGKYKVALRCFSANRLDTNLLKTDCPEVYQNYLKRTESRTLKLMAG